MTKLTGRARTFAGCALAAAMFGTFAIAQGSAQESNNQEARASTETIYLANATSQNDLNEVQTALRNNFPRAKIYGVEGQFAITVRDTPENLPAIKKLVAELDRPKKIYRVTYSVSDVENGKRQGTRRYSVVVAAGAQGTLKQGKRIPFVTAASGEGANASSGPQVQYVDIGVSIEARIEAQGLRTRVEVSSVADEKSGLGAQDPVIQQTMMENTSTLMPGKPVVLGTLEIPGTSQQKEIEVSTEQVSN